MCACVCRQNATAVWTGTGGTSGTVSQRREGGNVADIPKKKKKRGSLGASSLSDLRAVARGRNLMMAPRQLIWTLWLQKPAVAG